VTGETMTNAEAQRFVQNVVERLAAFVPPDRREEFFAVLREELVRVLDERDARRRRSRLRAVDARLGDDTVQSE
jgi:hypothetical protein